MELTSHHQPEEFGKGQKETPHVLPTSQNPPRWNPSWLSNAWGMRKNSQSEWLARENPETKPITIKSETAVLLGSRTLLLSTSTLPNKVSCFVSTVSPWTTNFFFFFNLRIIALQNFVGFCQTSTWIRHRYTNYVRISIQIRSLHCNWVIFRLFLICMLPLFSLSLQFISWRIGS